LALFARFLHTCPRRSSSEIPNFFGVVLILINVKNYLIETDILPFSQSFPRTPIGMTGVDGRRAGASFRQPGEGWRGVGGVSRHPTFSLSEGEGASNLKESPSGPQREGPGACRRAAPPRTRGGRRTGMGPPAWEENSKHILNGGNKKS